MSIFSSQGGPAEVGGDRERSGDAVEAAIARGARELDLELAEAKFFQRVPMAKNLAAAPAELGSSPSS